MADPQPLGTLVLDPVRCFTAEDGLRALLAAAEPWVGPTIERLAAALPAPPTVAAFIAGPFFCRLPTSVRCFYYFPTAEKDVPGGAIAFKGLEPCAPDFGELLADFKRPGPSPHDIAEHFVHEEHKVPGCLTLDEALFEAERAASLQRAHLAAYGEPAHAPIPLFVFRHGEATVARTTQALRERLSAPAFRAVERQLDRGLGAYVYYYPALPLRVRDIDFLLQGVPFRERLLGIIGTICDPGEIVAAWVRNFTRMLYCGFIPGSLASLRTGMSCQPQNACIDGGFVDLDSLIRFTGLKDDAAVAAALHISVDALIDSVRTLICGNGNPARGGASSVRVDLHHLREYVLALLRAAVEREARPGVPVDPRVATYLTPATDLAALVDRLAAFSSRPSRFEKETREFMAEAPHLFRTLRHGPRS